MNSDDRSVSVTAVIIRIAMVLCVISLFIMPYAADRYDEVSIYSDSVKVPLMVTFYICAAVGFVILFVLDKLVSNIRKKQVFTEENVKYLRILSYCCFGITIVTLVFARLRIIVFIITFAAAFFGLILRVIKNCFAEAVKLREENDFTI